MSYEPGLFAAALRRASQRKATARPKKALVLAGLVESNGQHKKYSKPGSGDRDSVGFLQQRPSQGWGPAGESIETDTDQFLDHAIKLNATGKYKTAGQLAQAVQRSAFPERYDQRSAEAEKILQSALGSTQDPGSSRASSRTMSLGSMPGMSPAMSEEPSVFDVIRRYAIATDPDLSDEDRTMQQQLLNAAVRSQAPAAPPTNLVPMLNGTPARGESTPGSLKPGGGYKGTQGLARQLAGIGLDLGLKSTSEKRNNTNPHSGKGSDHDFGNKDAYAFDISNGDRPTKEMDRAAYRIMRQIGFDDYEMGQPIDTSRGVKTIKTKQGTFRVQVIYRGTGAAFGGNHLNHIHVGVKKVG